MQHEARAGDVFQPRTASITPTQMQPPGQLAGPDVTAHPAAAAQPVALAAAQPVALAAAQHAPGTKGLWYMHGLREKA